MTLIDRYQEELRKIKKVEEKLGKNIERPDLTPKEKEALKEIKVLPPLNLELLSRWQILDLLRKLELVGRMKLTELEEKESPPAKGPLITPEEIEEELKSKET